MGQKSAKSREKYRVRDPEALRRKMRIVVDWNRDPLYSRPGACRGALEPIKAESSLFRK
jgi:hypothetical protein